MILKVPVPVRNNGTATVQSERLQYYKLQEKYQGLLFYPAVPASMVSGGLRDTERQGWDSRTWISSRLSVPASLLNQVTKNFN